MTNPVSGATVHSDDLERLLDARHHDPFSVLGPHEVHVGGDPAIAIRTLQPAAESVDALVSDGKKETCVRMSMVDPGGFFEAVLPGSNRPVYRLRVTRPGGHAWDIDDPYRYASFLGEMDQHLFQEGNHFRAFEKLGAHLISCDGTQGVLFAVWAPNAERVSVVGEFNGWDGRRHSMRQLGSCGIWEIFIPGLSEGDLYKFEILTTEGHLRVKTDPYGFCSEYRPGTSSVVHDIDKHSWSDGEWMECRSRWNVLEAPVSIYEVHLGSWMRVPEEGNRFLNYRELAHRLVEYVRDLGFTHIELLPVQEHPLDASWGYQATGFFAPTSRFGSPDDFMYFVDHCHQNGIGVILDWVPAHFPRDEHGLRLFDGTHLYEHADPRQGEHRDWGTLIFNYGRNEVKNFLVASALFWLEKYHIDGLRVDAVASMLYLDYSREEGDWIPNAYGGRENLAAIEFLKTLNSMCHKEHAGILTIAEESTAWPGVSHPTYLGGLGFNMKWNMGWMNDTLSYFAKDPVYRRYHHQSLTFSLLYAFTENFILPLSHDEVVHGKRSLLDQMPGDSWQKFANLRTLLGFQFTHPGKKLLFMGCEFGMGLEWNQDQSLDWHLLEHDVHAGVQRFVKDLNRLYQEEAALHQVDFGWDGFDWIDFKDWESSIISFRRRSRDPREEVIVVFNFTPVERQGYRIGVPEPGYYAEIMNSDASIYGGGGRGNLGGVSSEPLASHGLGQSIAVNLPALALLVFKRRQG